MGRHHGNGGGYKFSKIFNFVWKLKFYHWWCILSIVFLEVTGLLGSFLKPCLPDTQVGITMVGLFCSFFMRGLCLEAAVFSMQQKCCCSIPTLSHRILKSTQRLRFNKINNFYVFYQGHSLVKWNWSFPEKSCDNMYSLSIIIFVILKVQWLTWKPNPSVVTLGRQ